MIQDAKKRASVLVVDNDEASARECRRLLLDSGFGASAVKNGDAAMKYLSSITPDLVLVDIQPGEGGRSNGADCVRSLRSSGFDGVICFLISEINSDVLLSAAAAGADTFLPKNNLSVFVPDMIKAILDLKTRASQSPDSQAHSAVYEVYLRACGLEPQQIELLFNFHSLGYPSVNDLALALNMEPIAVTMRLKRIKSKLSFENNHQIAAFMTALSAFSKLSLVRPRSEKIAPRPSS